MDALQSAESGAEYLYVMLYRVLGAKYVKRELRAM